MPVPEDRSRLRAAEVSGLVHQEGLHLSDALSRSLRKGIRLPPWERQRVTELVRAVLRSERLLDFALARISTRPFPAPGLELARVVAHEVHAEELAPASARRILPPYDWDGFRAACARVDEIEDPVERFGVRHSLSDPIAAALLQQFGAQEAEVAARALAAVPPIAIRVNRVRATREELAPRLTSSGLTTVPSNLAPDGLRVVEGSDPFRTEAFTDGWFEVQDEGSQLIAEVVAPPPAGRVVDYCAGAGGKTLHLAAIMAGRGRILALDVPPAHARLEELRRRARRAGLTNIAIATLAPQGAGAELPPPVARWLGQADRVLVDAPCSGTGSLRRNPEARLRIDGPMLARLPEQQGAILDAASHLVQPGGRLVYATCSILRSENDAVVDAFRERHPEFVPVPIKEVLGRARALEIGDGERLRLLPHRHGTDGFFAAVLRRSGQGSA